MSSSNSKWICFTCTFNNPAKAQACEVCETPRPANFSLRLRTPTDLFTLELQAHTTFEVLKVLVESRCGIPAPSQRLFYGSPKRELFGRDREHVQKVLEINPEDPIMTLQVEVKGDAASSSTGEADDEDTFVAYLEFDPRSAASGVVVPGVAAPSASPMSTTIVDGDGEEESDPFADGAEDDGDGWGDDGEDLDAFVDEDETDDMGQKHASETKSEASNAMMQSSAKNKKLGEYDVLDLPALFAIMKESLVEISDALGSSLSDAAVLSRRYRWANDRLFQEYLENPAAVQEKSGLMRMKHRLDAAESSDAAAKSVAASSESTQYGECPLCGDEMTGATSLDLGCTSDGSHRYCLDCWRNWATAEIDKGPQAVFTTCCAYQCKEIIPDDTFLNLLDLRKRRLLSKFFMRSYVDARPNLRWCVNSRCSRIIRFTQGGARDIECECGARFCFACGFAESHSPCQCELVEKWNSKNSNDKGNQDWLLANTKPCPGCKTHTEKNSGCNHMVCRSCKAEYCWLCMGEWSKHNSASGGYYQCNIYETVKAKNGASEQEKASIDAQAKIKKYQFYYNRWLEYEKSIQSALAQIAVTQDRMEALQSITGCDVASVEYLLDANKTVIETRRALKWSYVVGFYLAAESRQLHMFQLDQGQLEKFSDELHGLIELPIERLLPFAHAPIKPTTPIPMLTPTVPTPASPSSATGSSASPTAAAAAVTAHGEELKKLIQTKTTAANKYLVNLVDAVLGGQYVDLTLTRLPSA